MQQGNWASALQSLDGLSVGDAFGECFFSIALNDLSWQMHLSTRTLPTLRWLWTDDTAMAFSLLEILKSRGHVDQDDLAAAFAARYMLEDFRGYGGTAHGILRAIHAGEDWRAASLRPFSGMGSMGNGGAMRAAPLGAFFADDVGTVIEEARKSAQVTHAHPEGQAGAIAAALAAAWMSRQQTVGFDRGQFFDFLLHHMPDSQTRARIAQARDIPEGYSIETAASVLGNGSDLTAPDTVPFCLWCVARSPANFEEAIWSTVSAGGDMDTNCAIVGGIIAAATANAPPPSWLGRREPLPGFQP